jgi:hypothetical protein
MVSLFKTISTIKSNWIRLGEPMRRLSGMPVLPFEKKLNIFKI